MKKIQKKKGVTILALVITIIIMLLLAGVVIQMAVGDNGLIAKVNQSKIEQAKAENFSATFYGATKSQTIPGNLFYNNIEAKRFDSTFAGTKITDIPWSLFDNNNNAESFNGTFSDCMSLTYLNLPNRCYSLQESQYRGIFRGCTNAHNYSSIPESWKSW